ncbi:L-2-hydroxyglutarate oxidase [Streptomyces lonarensis]|uniref:L-2-hydroxyglutarate oxidase n=1 Tax=Streptomyces lonarensis TaxID=700599 RepID=A0A7X6D2M1_9ACTN|nr:L-2-hydroxyglutarate oxidase [Streptomyces lonarensis]NJQ07056.1 L-2-hydroxyglutarate oxidase [Streptomyces lonarensis]
MTRAPYDCDVLVAGAGIVGLATAHALRAAAPRLRVVVVEKEAGPARHQSGRNSGVVHSGVAYRPGSLKARLAVAGGAEMLAYCAEHGIAHARPGKVVLATTSEEVPRLRELAQRGRANGVAVEELSPRRLAALEPHVRAVAALRVPSTGVCDFRAVAARLTADLDVRYGAAVTVVDQRPGRGVAIGTEAGHVLRARALVTCAGLYGDRLARLAGVEPGLRIIPFRGEYRTLAPRAARMVRGLVYPVADPALPFLGVHLTRGTDGTVHAGPNAVPAPAREGYRWSAVDPAELVSTLRYPGTRRLAARYWRTGAAEIRRSLSPAAFAAAVRRLLPAVEAADLLPAPAGVRAQAVLPDGTLLDDFRFAEGPHSVHVLNAPSPAATAAFPIGREIAERTLRRLAGG